MKKKMIIFFIAFFIGLCNIKADIQNYNGSSSASLGGLGSGSWNNHAVGIKVSIVSKDNVVRDSEIIVANNNYVNSNTYLSTNTNPKFKQNTTIGWDNGVK